MEKIINKLEKIAEKDVETSLQIGINVFFIGQCLTNKKEIIKTIDEDKDKIVELNIMMEKSKQKIAELLGLEISFEEIFKIYKFFLEM